MKTYISILRGINVSGHKMIKMDALKQLYSDLGFKNISTYIQSGNVIFQESKSKTKDLEKKIADKISKQFGFDVPVFVKEVEEVREITKNNPFLKLIEDPSKLHITFLSDEPAKEDISKISAATYAPDEFVIKGKTIYIFCPNGYGNTKLNNSFFENKLKVRATTRNWKTTNELVRIAGLL